MKLKGKNISQYKLLREQGDIAEIARLTGKNPATISRVLAGKESAKPEILLLIKGFFAKRRVIRAKVEQD